MDSCGVFFIKSKPTSISQPIADKEKNQKQGNQVMIIGTNQPAMTRRVNEDTVLRLNIKQVHTFGKQTCYKAGCGDPNRGAWLG